MSVRTLEIGSEMLRRKIFEVIRDGESKFKSFFITLTINPKLNTLPVQEQYNKTWNVVQNLLNFFHMVITIPEFTSKECNLHYHIVATMTNAQYEEYRPKIHRQLIVDHPEWCEEYEGEEEKFFNNYFVDALKAKIRGKIATYFGDVLGHTNEHSVDVEAINDPSHNFVSYLYKDVDRTIKIGGYGVLKYTIRSNDVDELKLEKLVNYKFDKKNI